MSVTRRRWLAWLAALAVLAGGVRAWHLVEVRDSPRWRVLIGDAGKYHAWAREIAAGDWIGSGVFYQAPLYPYWLGTVYCVTGADPAAARWVQAGVGVVSCVVLALAGRAFFGATAGLLAGLLLALSPAEIFHESLLEKSGLTTLLMAALLWVLGQTLRAPQCWRMWVLVGAVAGLLSLARENALLLTPVLIAWAIWNPRLMRARGRALVLMLIGISIPLGPVLVRNRLVGGEWRLTTAQFGPNFYIGNNAAADGTYVALVPEHGTPVFEQDDAARIASDAAGRELTAGEVDRWWIERTLADIRRDPGRWLGLVAQKLALTWSNVELADSEDQYTAAGESRVLSVLTGALPFGALAGLAAFSVVVLGRSLRRMWVLPAIVVVYTFSVALFYVFARYRLPLTPVLAVLCGAGVVRGRALVCRLIDRPRGAEDGRASSHGHRAGLRLASGIVVGAMALVLTLPGVVGPLFAQWPDASISHMQAVTEFNLGLRLWEQNAPLDEIESHLAASTRLYPEYASAWLYWGHVLAENGQRERAIEKFARAAEFDPEGADIRLELGESLLLLGRPAEALPHLEHAATLTPDDPDAQYLFGRALYLCKRREDALAPLQEAVRLDPEFVPSRRLLAITLDQLGRTSEAEAEFRELQRRLPASDPEQTLIQRRLNQRRSLMRRR
jgi:tetratricopeptide (TPR) repeat protein